MIIKKNYFCYAKDVGISFTIQKMYVINIKILNLINNKHIV